MKTVKVLVKEPGKGKAVNPYSKGNSPISTAHIIFERENPERPAIDLNGHDLQPREQPYECVLSWFYISPDTGLTAIPENGAVVKKQRGYHVFEAYQSIEDVVKGEKYLTEAKPFDAIDSTPVNEAKEGQELWKEVYSAIAHALGYPGNNSDVKDITLATNNVMGVMRATHPIENKEGVKSVEQLLVELQDKLHYETYPSDNPQAIHKIEHLQGDYFPVHMVKAIAENYHSQFTPIEQGKRMVSDWISVADVMPPFDTIVLLRGVINWKSKNSVSYFSDVVKNDYEILEYGMSGYLLENNSDYLVVNHPNPEEVCSEFITHWMPLHEPNQKY